MQTQTSHFEAVLAEEASSVLTDRMRALYDFNPALVIVGMGASVLSGMVGAAVPQHGRGRPSLAWQRRSRAATGSYA